MAKLTITVATLEFAQKKGLTAPKPVPNRFERMTLRELLALDLVRLREKEGMEVALQAARALTAAANKAI